MRKMIAFALSVVLFAGLLAGCCLSHDWVAATCEAPAVCTKCGQTEGEALGHEWKAATCEKTKTCAVCGKTEGEPLEHAWQGVTCEEPKTCTKCGKTEGRARGHLFVSSSCEEPEICEYCGMTGQIEGHTWLESVGICSRCGASRVQRYDDTNIFLDCDTYVELFEQRLTDMGYVILEWEGEKPKNPIRNFEIFEVDNPTGIMTLVLPYDPQTSNMICLTLTWTMEEEEVETEMEKYVDIVMEAYGILCPEGMDNNLALQLNAYVGQFGALITPVNAPLDAIDWTVN